MEFKAWTILFMIVAAQGMLVGLFLLFRSKTWNSVSIHLSILMFAFSAILALWVGFWNDWNYHFPSLSYFHIATPLLFGPALFLHIRTLNGKKNWPDLFHYTPFLLVIMYFAPYFFKSPEAQILYIQANLQNPNAIISNALYLQNISLIVYVFLLFRVVISDQKKEKWTRGSRLFFLVFTIVYVTCSFTFHFIAYNLYIDVIGAVIMVVSIYSIGYLSFNRLSVFHRLDLSKTNKYNGSSLTREYATKVVEQLSDFLRKDKTFTSSEMTLRKVSGEIEIPSHYISESLNKYEGISFSDFINHLRVEEAKIMLRSSEYENLKVESIGYAVGFNSKTTFYNAFKKETGQSPAGYQKVLELA